jgi:hypothetical protein
VDGYAPALIQGWNSCGPKHESVLSAPWPEAGAGLDMLSVSSSLCAGSSVSTSAGLMITDLVLVRLKRIMEGQVEVSLTSAQVLFGKESLWSWVSSRS